MWHNVLNTLYSIEKHNESNSRLLCFELVIALSPPPRDLCDTSTHELIIQTSFWGIYMHKSACDQAGATNLKIGGSMHWN